MKSQGILSLTESGHPAPSKSSSTFGGYPIIFIRVASLLKKSGQRKLT